ncbi:MAG TPA: DUF1684 domain-containing protein [Thermoanaerobaculia bacterium]|jgi:hypothetical protein
MTTPPPETRDQKPGTSISRAYIAEIEAWRAKRLERLRAEDGWPTVVGLFWLEEGENPVGSASGNRIVLPAGKAPPVLGSIDLSHGRVSLRVRPGADVHVDGKRVKQATLSSDADGQPTVVTYGTLRFYLIERVGRLAVRVKDSASEARRRFHGLDSFPIDPAWRLEARFEPYDPPNSIAVPNVLGAVDSERSPGAIVFEYGGKAYRLDSVLEKGEIDYFVIFGDRTNGAETYGAGRFLYVSPPAGGKTVIDFNKAYNPPCVFTPYATCPLPPLQNKLPIRVEAGEKAYEH